MSMQSQTAQVVRADPWTLFCAACSQRMRIIVATPALEGRETRTYECACGQSERIDVAIPKFLARQRYRKMIAAARSRPGGTTRLSTVRQRIGMAPPHQPCVTPCGLID